MVHHLIELRAPQSANICCIEFVSLFIPRLEYFTQPAQSSVTQQEAEGDVQDVWDLCCRFSQHPQCLSGCHGAAGVLRDHAR